MKKDIYKASVCYKDLKDMINCVAQDFKEEAVIRYNRDGKKVEITFDRFKKDIDSFGTYLYDQGF